MPRHKQSGTQRDLERNIKDGSLCSHESEVDYVKSTSLGSRNVVYPLYQTEISDFEFEFLKTYLYALDTGALSDERLRMKNFAAMGTLSHPVIIPPLVTSSDENGLALINNDFVYALIAMDGSDYQVTVFMKVASQYGQDTVKYFMSAVGIQPDSFRTKEMTEYLTKKAISHSYFRNKMLAVSMDDHRFNIEEMDPCEFSDEGLEQIYVPAALKNELHRFCSCVDLYQKHRLGLRFLLCGEPGTGKTKSVRSIINTCRGKSTILLVRGEINFKKLFAFAELLQPCIICLDDLDLIVGSRDRHFSPTSLSAFLQELDGFRKNDVFLLATTNDKDLIDRAASRPGRFDLLIDYSRLDRNNYADLIHTNCINGQILAVFDDELLKGLRKKRVTGAFITNLLKQLEIKNQIDPGDDLRAYAVSLIELSYHGFYKKKEENEMAFGFNGHDD